LSQIHAASLVSWSWRNPCATAFLPTTTGRPWQSSISSIFWHGLLTRSSIGLRSIFLRPISCGRLRTLSQSWQQLPKLKLRQRWRLGQRMSQTARFVKRAWPWPLACGRVTMSSTTAALTPGSGPRCDAPCVEMIYAIHSLLYHEYMRLHAYKKPPMEPSVLGVLHEGANS
jgi:hypothetical protein